MDETNLEQILSLYKLNYESATISRAVVCRLQLNFLIITIGTFRSQFFPTKLFNLKVDRKTFCILNMNLLLGQILNYEVLVRAET